MDRDRLKEVHKTETTESRVNEDFIDWLKNKGPTWLLVVLVALTAYLGLVRWRTTQQTQQIQAWRALNEAEATGFPASLRSVAEDFPRVDAIAIIARLNAAQILMESVITGQRPGATIGQEDTTLSPEDRELNLNRADEFYREVLAADDGTLRMALHAVSAHNGRAAVAEARGDAEAARQHYLDAAQRAEAAYPYLAQQARQRAEGEPVAAGVELPSDADVFTPADALDRRPATIDPALRDMLQR